MSNSKIADDTITVNDYNYVNHPSHYNMWSMETIDMMIKVYGLQNTITWCEMTAFKYAMRMGFKPNESVYQDLDKRNWYLNKANELKSQLNNQLSVDDIINIKRINDLTK